MEFASPCLVDVADGYYQLGFPGPAESFAAPIVATATGAVIPTGPETEVVELTIGRADASEISMLEGHGVDVDVSEEWAVLTGMAEPASPPTGAIVGPGQWRVALRVTGTPMAIQLGGEDVVETVVESHILMVCPLDAAAEVWRPAPPLALPHDSVNDGWFLKAGTGEWTLSSDREGLELVIEQGLSRVVAAQGGAAITFHKRSEITVIVQGREYRPMASESWVLAARGALPSGASLILRRPDGERAKGLPLGAVLTGPATVRIFLRNPDEQQDFGDDEPVLVYTRDTPQSDDVVIEVLLDR